MTKWGHEYGKTRFIKNEKNCNLCPIIFNSQKVQWIFEFFEKIK